MRKLFVLIAALALSGCAGPSKQDAADLLNSLTPEHFRDTAKIIDDPLETNATISMEPGFHDPDTIGRDGWECEAYLRAFIDKRSGATTYQLYVDIAYINLKRRLYDSINYSTPQGIQSVPVMKISRDKSNCRKDDCIHEEVVGLMMPEAMVRQIAATYVPNGHNPWLFKLKGKYLGEDYEDGIMPSEAAGLLMAVQAYKASLHH